MKREFDIIAWDTRNKAMLPLTDKGLNPLNWIGENGTLDEYFNNIQEYIVFMKGTGQKDIRGEKIYEDFIVDTTIINQEKSTNLESNVAKVGFYDGSYVLEDNIGNLEILTKEIASSVTVVGNTHSSPELFQQIEEEIHTPIELFNSQYVACTWEDLGGHGEAISNFIEAYSIPSFSYPELYDFFVLQKKLKVTQGEGGYSVFDYGDNFEHCSIREINTLVGEVRKLDKESKLFFQRSENGHSLFKKGEAFVLSIGRFYPDGSEANVHYALFDTEDERQEYMKEEMSPLYSHRIDTHQIEHLREFSDKLCEFDAHYDFSEMSKMIEKIDLELRLSSKKGISFEDLQSKIKEAKDEILKKSLEISDPWQTYITATMLPELTLEDMRTLRKNLYEKDARWEAKYENEVADLDKRIESMEGDVLVQNTRSSNAEKRQFKDSVTKNEVRNTK